MTESLEYDPSLAEGLDFIRAEYAEMLPEDVASPEDSGTEPIDSQLV